MRSARRRASAFITAATRIARGALAAKLIAWLAPTLAPALLTILLLFFTVAALFGPAQQAAGGDAGALRYGASAFALEDIPRRYLDLYQAAAQAYRIDWATLAAIGKVETDHGRSDAPGVHSGQNSHGCCAGPMQFHNDYGRGGGTWAAYAIDANSDGRTDIYDPADAITSAAHLLAASGARAEPRRAIYAYNHAWWYVDQVEEIAARYRGALLKDPAGNGTLTLSDGLLAWPVHGPVSSGFGIRSGRPHQGIDIAVDAGTPVRAPAAGTIVHAGWMSGYGNLICINHTPALSTCSAHASSLRAVLGQHLKRGEIVALSGCTGRCFGNHVHFEVHAAPTWTPSSARDPMGYLGGGG